MKAKIFIISLVLILFMGINADVAHHLKLIFPSSVVSFVVWSSVALISILLVCGLLRLQTKGMDVFFKVVTHLFLIVFVGEAVFVVVTLLGDVYRVVMAIYDLVLHQQFVLGNGNEFFVWLGLTLFVLTICLFLYGIFFGKYAYRVIKHTLYFDDLPSHFDGFTITQISDIHAGSFNNVKAVQKGIDLIHAQKSDVFVFTGDLVNNKATEIEPWLPYFSQIKSTFGQFSVLGNHDYGDYVSWESKMAKEENLAQLKRHHQALGFRLLLDESVEIEKEGQKIIIAGVENWGLGFGQRGNLEQALKETEMHDFKILLSHDPSHWEAEVKKHPSKVHLTLAGHTHGMQFGVEFLGIKWSPVKYRYKHWAGIKEQDGRFLNINRGFGFLGFSGRIGILPEITVIELKKKMN